MSAQPHSSRSPHTRWPIAALLGVVGGLVVTLVVLAFLWPTKTSEARNLPVSVTGPAASVSALQDALDENAAGTFDLVAADDRADAVSQIEARVTYGAIILGAGTTPPEVLTAPAGSAVAAQLLAGVASQLQSQAAQRAADAGGDPSTAMVEVTAVVPLSEADPTGAGLAAASFPLTMGGMIGGILISLLVVGVIRRLVALAGFAVATGVVLTLVLQTWFEFLQGSFVLNATAIGLSVLATSAFIVGFTSLLGPAGIGVGAVVTMFVANPISAAATPWQFIAEPWGAVGQFMVPGASNWLIRSLSYFPAADVSMQWGVLAVWALVGIALALVGHFRSRPTIHAPEATLEDDAARV